MGGEEEEGFGGRLSFPERFARFSPQDGTQSARKFSVAGPEFGSPFADCWGRLQGFPRLLFVTEEAQAGSATGSVFV